MFCLASSARVTGILAPDYVLLLFIVCVHFVRYPHHRDYTRAPLLCRFARNFNFHRRPSRFHCLRSFACDCCSCRCASYSATSASALCCTSWADSRQVNGNQYKLKVKKTPGRQWAITIRYYCFPLFMPLSFDGITFCIDSLHFNRTLECVSIWIANFRAMRWQRRMLLWVSQSK